MGTEKFHILTIYLLQEIIGINANNYSINLCTNISTKIIENYPVHINQYCPCDKNNLTKECCSFSIYNGVTKNSDSNNVFEIACINKNLEHFTMNLTKSKENFYIQENETVYLPHFENQNNSDLYCFDKNNNLLIYLCRSGENSQRFRREFHISAKIISLLCVVVTFTLYAAALPDRTLFEKSLMCHCCCLICVYICSILNIRSCTILGYLNIVTVYFLFSSIIWINIMCIFRWLAFRVLQGYDLPNRVQRRERRLFITMSIYGWGAPCIHILVTSFEKYYGNCVRTNYPLGANTQQCLLKNEPSNPFICFPSTLILIILNIVLLILTAFNIKRFSRGLDILKKFQTFQIHNHKKRKATFYYKLLFAMFFNPLAHFQIIQLLIWTTGKTLIIYDNVYILYVIDFLHLIYGIFIIYSYAWTNIDLWRILRQKYIKKTSKKMVTVNPGKHTTNNTFV